MTDPGAVLAAAVREVLPSLNYYIGPGARTAVSRESEDSYYAVVHAMRRVEGKPCPRCDDTCIDKQYAFGPHRCRLADLPLHPAPSDEVQQQLDARQRERAAKRDARDDAELEAA